MSAPTDNSDSFRALGGMQINASMYMGIRSDIDRTERLLESYLQSTTDKVCVDECVDTSDLHLRRCSSLSSVDDLESLTTEQLCDIDVNDLLIQDDDCDTATPPLTRLKQQPSAVAVDETVTLTTYPTTAQTQQPPSPMCTLATPPKAVTTYGSTSGMSSSPLTSTPVRPVTPSLGNGSSSVGRVLQVTSVNDSPISSIHTSSPPPSTHHHPQRRNRDEKHPATAYDASAAYREIESVNEVFRALRLNRSKVDGLLGKPQHSQKSATKVRLQFHDTTNPKPTVPKVNANDTANLRYSNSLTTNGDSKDRNKPQAGALKSILKSPLKSNYATDVTKAKLATANPDEKCSVAGVSRSRSSADVDASYDELYSHLELCARNMHTLVSGQQTLLRTLVNATDPPVSSDSYYKPTTRPTHQQQRYKRPAALNLASIPQKTSSNTRSQLGIGDHISTSGPLTPLSHHHSKRYSTQPTQTLWKQVSYGRQRAKSLDRSMHWREITTNTNTHCLRQRTDSTRNSVSRRGPQAVDQHHIDQLLRLRRLLYQVKHVSSKMDAFNITA